MEERTFYDYWLLFYRRKNLMRLIVLSSLIFTWLISRILPQVYETKVVFYLAQNNPSYPLLNQKMGSSVVKEMLYPEITEDLLETFIGILNSNTLREKVQLDFPQKSLADLRRDVDLQLSEENLFEVYARDKDPRLAAEVANAYAQHFDQLLQGYSAAPVAEVKSLLERKLKATKQQLDEAKQALVDFQQNYQIVSWDKEISVLINKRIELQTALENKQVSLNENKKKIESMEKYLAKEAKILVSSEVMASNPLIESLKKNLSNIEIQLSGFTGELSEFHPQVVKLKSQAQQIRENLKTEIENVLNSQIKTSTTFYENLRQELVGLYVNQETQEVEKMSLKRIIAGIEKDMLKLPQIGITLEELSHQVTRHQQMHDSLLMDLEEAKMQENCKVQSIVIVDHASPPKAPAFPILWLNMLVGLGLGFIGAIFYCLLLDYIERVRTLNQEQDLEFHAIDKIQQT